MPNQLTFYMILRNDETNLSGIKTTKVVQNYEYSFVSQFSTMDSPLYGMRQSQNFKSLADNNKYGLVFNIRFCQV